MGVYIQNELVDLRLLKAQMFVKSEGNDLNRVKEIVLFLILLEANSKKSQ